MSPVSALQLQIQSPEHGWLDVGVLYNADERNWFESSGHYWDSPNRPVLGQVFEERGRDWQPSSRIALPHWFSHLLPEGRLRQAVAAAAHTNKAREFNLLARIGLDDLPGALRVRSAEGIVNAKTPPELIEAELANGDSDPLLKFSLAGAQLKFSVYQGNKGLSIPVHGSAGNAIAKLPDGRHGYSGIPRTELACLELARLSGIPAPEARLAQVESIAGLEDWASRASEPALVVARFDRAGDDRRVHMEELAQILDIPSANENAKYKRANFETIGSVLSGLSGEDVVGEVIDRIALNVLVGNGDAHLKNWAVVYQDGITPSLSPLYDVLPTVLYLPGDDLGLKLAGKRDFRAVTELSFDVMGRRSGYGVERARRRAREAVERIVANWATLRDYLLAEEYDRLTTRRGDLELVAGEVP